MQPVIVCGVACVSASAVATSRTPAERIAPARTAHVSFNLNFIAATPFLVETWEEPVLGSRITSPSASHSSDLLRFACLARESSGDQFDREVGGGDVSDAWMAHRRVVELAGHERVKGWLRSEDVERAVAAYVRIRQARLGDQSGNGR